MTMSRFSCCCCETDGALNSSLGEDYDVMTMSNLVVNISFSNVMTTAVVIIMTFVMTVMMLMRIIMTIKTKTVIMITAAAVDDS